MGWPVENFAARVARIPAHGIGLSVDVFSPSVLELCQALDSAGAPPAYLELFKAPARELALVRAALPEMPLAYHAEGLWLIDPAMRAATPWRAAVETMARHAETIGAGWVNHECAGKQMGGYSFGTYLPPLLTEAAATVVAANAVWAQEGLDEWCAPQGRHSAAPLLLLELPPLTYFGFGALPVAEFFAQIAAGASCGLVLDVGHLWTHWRYREHRRFRSLEAFTEDFLATFPLDRVVQIHLAGLGLHDTDKDGNRFSRPPAWIDKHDAPVPAALFDLLRHVLEHQGLTVLKGIALEVDGKDIPVIVEEFGRLREEVNGKTWSEGRPRENSAHEREGEDEGALADLYQAYARVVSGQDALETSLLAPLAKGLDAEGLARYRTHYLPFELVCWGGDLAALFPAIWTLLERRGLSVTDFMCCWFRQSRSVTDPYDFFYVKLDRWVEFIGDVAPDLLEQATSEAMALRALHVELNDESPWLERRT